MIRRPQDQVISHFLHRRRGHHWKDRSELFTDFRNFLGEAWSRNWQAAFLSGLDKQNYLTPSPDELSGMALANLKKIDLVAGTDQLDKAVVFLRRELGVAPDQIGRPKCESGGTRCRDTACRV